MHTVLIYSKFYWNVTQFYIICLHSPHHPPPPLFPFYVFLFYFIRVGVVGEFWQNFIWARVGMRLKRFLTLILNAWLLQKIKRKLLYMLEKERQGFSTMIKYINKKCEPLRLYLFLLLRCIYNEKLVMAKFWIKLAFTLFKKTI